MSPDALAFLNGRFVPPAELTLSFHDAGFVAGATVTDFCRTYRRALFRWPDHLARFRHDCAACRIPLPYSDAELTAAADRLVAHNATLLPPDGELAVVTFATPGPLGYLAGLPDNGPPTVGMHAFPLPVGRYRRFFTDGVTLAVAGVQPTGIIPAGVKHRSRLHWWLADRAVAETDLGAVAVLLGPGGAPDTAIGGVLGVVGDSVVGPPPGAVLESVSVGVVRELCDRVGLTFRMAGIDWLRGAALTEVLLAGSGFGLAGVRRFVGPEADRSFDWPGPVYRALTAAWSELVGVDVRRQMLGGP